MKRLLLGIVLLTAAHSALASGQSKIAPLNGGLSYSPIQFNTLSPTSNELKMSNGSDFSLFGEKRFGFFHLYLTAAVDYLRTTGTANYSYFSQSGIIYTANQVGFTYDGIGASLGVKVKIIEDSLFRPYVEGGGEAFYTQFSYDSSLRTAAVTSLGSDFKTIDSFLDFAPYAEAGVEADLTNQWGLKLGARYTHHSSRMVETMAKRTITYDTMAYVIGLFFKF